jgi:hypothetical protein
MRNDGYIGRAQGVGFAGQHRLVFSAKGECSPTIASLIR